MTTPTPVRPGGPTPRPVILRARKLSFIHPGGQLFEQLSFDVPAGLTFVRGGDGRGKTSLLRILAGMLKPSSGHVDMVADDSPSSSTTKALAFLADPDGERDNATTARAWLKEMGLRFAHWDRDLENELIEAFALGDHVAKPMSMLSTGTRRKVALVAAFSCRADLVLLEKPFAALDGPSRGVLTDLLREAAEHPSRAWVLADFELPPGLAPARLAQTLDLGD